MTSDKAPSSKKLYSMSVTRFLDCVCEENKENQRFCFILGSGASYTSGIRTGVKLMEHWRKELMDKGISYIQECAQAANYNWDECKNLFEGDPKVLKNEDYFTLYDIRFVGCPTVGYSMLEKEMEGKDPNVGYYYLASILANTENRLVITTNFDSLTEDALFYYSAHHPLVLGHEKLAPYVASVDRKPVVAKIHRDLLMDPMNHLEQMEKLQEDWRGPLSAALSRYVPIVIGYAGGDQTLMELLGQLKLKGIFWCTLEDTKEEDLPEQARKIIQDNHGHWVKIQGFDELMYRMATQMNHLPNLDEMNKKMNERHAAFQSKHEELTKKYNPSRMKESTSDDAQENAGMLQAVLQEEGNKDSISKDYNKILSRALSLWSTGSLNQALDVFTDVISRYPNLPKGYDYRSALYHKMKNYDLALIDADKAIELAPENAGYYYSRAVTLHAMTRYEDALKDRDKAIELDPQNAQYYQQRAITLHAMTRYEDALKDYDKAIELDPQNAEYYYGRSVTLHAMTRYEDALKDRDKAIELDPQNAKYYDSRSITLRAMKRYEDALKDCNQAVEFAPQNAIFWRNRGKVLEKLGKEEQARESFAKADDLEKEDSL